MSKTLTISNGYATYTDSDFPNKARTVQIDEAHVDEIATDNLQGVFNSSQSKKELRVPLVDLDYINLTQFTPPNTANEQTAIWTEVIASIEPSILDILIVSASAGDTLTDSRLENKTVYLVAWDDHVATDGWDNPNDPLASGELRFTDGTLFVGGETVKIFVR